MYRAWFSLRSPARDSRWRMTWPLEASSGAVPVWAAKGCDDGVGVVLAAVMDGHPHARGEGGLAQWAGGGRCRGSGWRDAEGGVEPVEGLLAGLKFPRQPQARRLDQVNPNTISAASSLARSTVWSRSSPNSRPPNPGARTIRSQSSGTVDGPSSSGEDGGHGRPRPLDRAAAGTARAPQSGGARPADPTVAAGRAPAGQA